MPGRRAPLVATAVAGCLAAVSPLRAQDAASTRADTLTIRTSAGTTLALDVGRDGSIVFDLLGQLWRLPSAGGTATPLTDAVADGAEDQDPAISPAGTHVAFTAERGGVRGLWLLDLATGHVSPLVTVEDPFEWAADPAWSPDGRHVAFARMRRPEAAGGAWSSEIALVDVRAAAVRRLHIEGAGEASLRTPAWSPDGGRIAFVDPSRGGRVVAVDADGGAAILLTPDSTGARSPAFAPDGRSIAFLGPDALGRMQVHTQALGGDNGPVQRTSHDDVAATRVRWTADGSLVYSADGRIRRLDAAGRSSEIPFTATLTLVRERIVLPPARFADPGTAQRARGFMGLALSPDARTIALIALGRIWLIDTNGSTQALADVPHTARGLAWSPDGAELAWSAGAIGAQHIFATDAHSGATRQLTALDGRALLPAYSPDGRWLAFVHQPDGADARLRLLPRGLDRAARASDTRDLGRTGLEWTGSGVDRPLWSPASDALLRVHTWDIERPPTGELVALDGTRRDVPVPDAPNFATWTNDGLVYARHDRLWHAPFDSAAAGEPVALGDAAAIYPSAAPDGTVVYVSDDGLRVRAPDGSERVIGWPVAYTTPAAERLLIRNVRIIDGTGAPATPPRDMLIDNGRIVQIADPGMAAADGARIIDAQGRFAMPGLMDLHAHTYLPELLPSSPYFGVTLVRDQGSAMAPLVAYADMIAAGVLPGPRVSYGGFQYYSDWPFDEESGRGVEPEVDARHVARSVALAHAFGAHHIKVRTFRRWDIHARMIDEAHRRGLRVTGHCAQQLPLVAAGIDAKEHIGVCSTRGRGRGLYRDMAMYDDVVQLFRAAGIGVVPTISYFGFAARLNEEPALLAAEAIPAALAPPPSWFGWMLRLSPAQRDDHERAARQARESTAKLARAGVVIGVGTDIWQTPLGVHMELEELVAAGMTPLEAIRAATYGSAVITGVEQDLGTLETGRLADLVLLDADPTEDIRNTRRIRHVIIGGRVVDRDAIVAQYGR